MLSSLLDISGKKTLLEAIEVNETSLGKAIANANEQCKLWRTTIDENTLILRLYRPKG